MKYTPVLKRLGEHAKIDFRWRNGLLLRSTNWLGDAIMTLPAAYQISRCMPIGCGFFVLCRKELAPIWMACPWVDVVIGMEGHHVGNQEMIDVRHLTPGVACVFPNSFGSAMDVYRCKVPQRVGRGGRLRSFMLTERLPEWPPPKGKGDCHQLSYYLELASVFGDVEYTADYPKLKVDLELARRLGMDGGNWLAIAPGAAFGPAKQWPPESFLEVARWHCGHGGRVALVGTAKEQPATAWLAERVPGALDLAGKTTLDELMSVLGTAKAVVANDSGAMHLAAAVGTSGVAIFGSTDPIATGPIGAPWRIVVSSEPCRPCFQRTCPMTEHPYRCLKGIGPEIVISELMEILS
ncbi:MAG: lipopolysaccharide heptosyltransferase II [Victivallales bacterium]|nr:lipopolysaccharide heptosyltransferase II [Victivallales bacterium]